MWEVTIAVADAGRVYLKVYSLRSFPVISQAGKYLEFHTDGGIFSFSIQSIRTMEIRPEGKKGD